MATIKFSEFDSGNISAVGALLVGLESGINKKFTASDLIAGLASESYVDGEVLTLQNQITNNANDIANIADTDSQTLSWDLATSALSISNGNTVDLSGLQVKIDANFSNISILQSQVISLDSNVSVNTGDIGVLQGNVISIEAELANIADTDNQTLTYNGATANLSISNGNNVILQEVLDNAGNIAVMQGQISDLQANGNIQLLSLDNSSNVLSISGGNTVDFTTVLAGGGIGSVTGGTNITTVPSGSDVTVNLDPNISVSSLSATNFVNTQFLTLDNINVNASATEINYLDGSTPGTATVNNAVVLDANKDIQGINELTSTNINVTDVTSTGNIDVGNINVDDDILLGSGTGGTITGAESISAQSLLAIGNLNVAGYLVDGIIDDDTLATASATTLATSESVKAYVDASAGGNFNPLTDQIVIGNGASTSGNSGIAIGHDAVALQNWTTAVGAFSEAAGQYTTAIGTMAGASSTTGAVYSTFVGDNAGAFSSGGFAVGVGQTAAQSGSGNQIIGIGRGAGRENTADNSIAIGTYSGSSGHGEFSIAIGFESGKNGTADNTIGINATGTTVAVGSQFGIDIRTSAAGSLTYNTANAWTFGSNVTVNGTLEADQVVTNGGVISGLIDPTQPDHAASKSYVDAEIAGAGSSYGNANVTAYAEAGWAGNIIPSANVTYDLGTTTNRWKDLWLSGNTIHLGDTSISADDGALSVDGLALENTYATTSSVVNTTTEVYNSNGVLPADPKGMAVADPSGAGGWYWSSPGTGASPIGLNSFQWKMFNNNGPQTYTVADVEYLYMIVDLYTVGQVYFNIYTGTGPIPTTFTSRFSFTLNGDFASTGRFLLWAKPPGSTTTVDDVEIYPFLERLELPYAAVASSGPLLTSEPIKSVNVQTRTSPALTAGEVEFNLKNVGYKVKGGYIQNFDMDIYNPFDQGVSTTDTPEFQGVTATTGTVRLASLTTTERDNLTPVNGDMIYNTTDSKLQGYQAGIWINLDGS